MTGPQAGGVLVTCEHGGNEVPAEHAALFEGREALLKSHRGWDPGTLGLARTLARELGAPLVEAQLTRLLVDLNRSPHNPRVFSEVTRALPRPDRLELLSRYHRPHWDAVRKAVSRLRSPGGPVLHLAIHSFTPVLDGVTRRPDVALLYDPARKAERDFAGRWSRRLAAAAPDRVIGRNDPYRGNADGLTTALRRENAERRYVGIEVEVNQRHVAGDGRFPSWVPDLLLETLRGTPTR